MPINNIKVFVQNPARESFQKIWNDGNKTSDNEIMERVSVWAKISRKFSNGIDKGRSLLLNSYVKLPLNYPSPSPGAAGVSWIKFKMADPQQQKLNFLLKKPQIYRFLTSAFVLHLKPPRS